ncbi:hypothetical protein VC625_07955 [Citrobacter freundii]|nr:hypothetical protein [Citrobacter freundii]MDV0653546.1 hypothetical protein [Citrobacter freundii]MDV0720609.1 hypothetical protein [Citrobacter freundii]MEB0615390.1 hypothetical protein [Citrobacter freundii]MEB0689246.1 hypothetical protein [Citrobacter freundii]
MSKIARYQGNVRAFASDAQGMERTVFGGTNQADDLTSQITASFLRGWGIVGASEHPSLEDFNAAMYAMSQFIAYQHQMGVPEWHAEQEYHIGSICTHNGESYQSLQNANIGSQPPSAKWTPVLTSKNGLANLGLQDTVNKAAGALQKGQNLSDIPDKEKARTALQLGSAATATLTTSKIDNTSGRVLKVGDFGLGSQTYGVIPDSRQVSERAAYGVSFSRVYKSPDAPRMDTYYNLLMLPDTLNGAFSALAMSNNETPIYRGYGVGSNNPINWVKLYDEKNKPTPADIGALPAIGGKLTGPLEIESTPPTLQLTETDTGKKYFIVVDNGNIRLNQDTLAGVNAILNFDATTKDWTLPAGVIPKKYDNFLSLFQKINQASLGINGWFKDTNTGLIIQWGIGGGEGGAKNYPIQFPIAFPNRCINIQVTLQSTSWDANSGSAMGQIINNTQAYCWSTHSFFWFAIGL